MTGLLATKNLDIGRIMVLKTVMAETSASCSTPTEKSSKKMSIILQKGE